MQKKINFPSIVILTLSSFFILAQCSKSLRGSGTGGTTLDPSGVKPDIQRGNCPYDCTDPRCKLYTSGYCGTPTPEATPTIVAVSDASKTAMMMNAFNGLNVNLVELSLEMGLPSTLQASDIDFQNLYLSYDASYPGGQALTAPFLTNSNSNPYNYGFTLYTDGICFGSPELTKSFTGQYIKTFNLFDGTIHTLWNYASADYFFSDSTGNFLTTGSSAIVRTAAAGGCGPAVNACVQDAYNNHGWVSKWLRIQTALIPETKGAIYADCAIHNCFNLVSCP